MSLTLIDDPRLHAGTEPPELATSGLALSSSFFTTLEHRDEPSPEPITAGRHVPFGLIFAEPAALRAVPGPSPSDLIWDDHTQTIVMGEDDPTAVATQCYECSSPACPSYDHVPDDQNTDAG